ncbi:MAG: response regulator [Myxococcota bacterium]
MLAAHSADCGRILIVEDTVPSARKLAGILSDAGHEPAWVQTGGEALHAVDEHGIDLVVLDLGLPDTDGITLLRGLKERSLPVVVVTGSCDLAVSSLAAGADGFFAKPVDAGALLARVNVVLAAARAYRALLDHYAQLEAERAHIRDGLRTWVHDLRNLFAVAKMNLQFALDENHEPAAGHPTVCRTQLDDALADALDAVGSMERISRTIAGSASSSDGQFELRFAEIDSLAALARDAAADLGPVVASRIAIEGDARTRGDTDLLRVVLSDLLRRAVGAEGAEGACVRATIDTVERGVLLKVRGTGKRPAEGGEDPAQGPHGIGLGLCELALRAHGGEFGESHEAESGGVHFWLTLPREAEGQPPSLS